jgi:hypothetical protein
MTLPEFVMVPLSKIKPNPWRNFKRNPIDTDKVAQLTESIKTTGEFWVGVYGRKVAGFVELAFGHNRLEAAKAVDTGDAFEAAKAAGLKSIPVVIREFTDGEMLMRMARENLRGDLPVVLEAVSAAVQALAEGKIEISEPDPKTRKDAIRYAPSFVPGKASDTSEVPHQYTADTLARFLGGVYVKTSSSTASNSVVAALGILELEERKVKEFSDKVYNGHSIREIIPMVADIKERVVTVQARRGKSAEEIAKMREQQLEAQAKIKAEEKKDEDERKALVKKIAEAQYAEDERKELALKARLKAEDKVAQEKEALNKLRRAEFEKQLADKKAWEAEQCIQDEYKPIRRDVENMLRKLETTVSEHNAFREDVKSLANRKGLRPEDKQRLRVAVVAVADWYNDWVAPQFAPELKAAQRRTVNKRKEVQSRAKGGNGA